MINLEKEIREQSIALKTVHDKMANKAKEIANAVKEKGIKKISFAARGTSDHACIYGQYLIGITSGIPCTLATPSVVTEYKREIDYSDELVIGVSQSGQAKDVIEVLKDAKKYGAMTLAITNEEDSPIVKEADYSLFCSCGKETSIAATKTFTTELYLMGLLASELGCDEELKSEMKKLPSLVSKLLSHIGEDIDKYISEYKDMKGASVVARGLLYPIALEGALKVLETNNVKMRGYALSDFHHGPKGQILKGDTIFIYACKGVCYQNSCEMIKEMLFVGADVIVLTDTNDNFDGVKVLRFENNTTYKYPDALSAYLCAITMQMFAVKLSLTKGIDPDKSVLLKKVTVTF